MALDDTLWDLLDKVRLGEFFDDHNIPPIAFPIIIIAVVAVVLFLIMMPPGEPISEEVCGDGMCQSNETAETCPDDCGEVEPDKPDGKTIKVYVSGGLTCDTIRVSLKDGSGNTVSTRPSPSGPNSRAACTNTQPSWSKSSTYACTCW
jgi:hypothetical protein